jgi:hypothetical protein
MQRFLEGQTLTFTVGFTNAEGAVVTPSSVSYVLYDADNVELLSVSDINPGIETEIEITISSSLNGAAASFDARLLKVTLHTSAGLITKDVYYVLERNQRLNVMENSFATYQAFHAIAMSMPSLQTSVWSEADEFAQKAGLEEAYRRLIEFQYFIIEDNLISFDKLTNTNKHITPDLWREMTEADFRELPEHFRNAMARAQICEANAIMNPLTLSRKTRVGVFSETIGERSMMFKPVKPLEMGLDAETVRILGSYINMRPRVTRG